MTTTAPEAQAMGGLLYQAHRLARAAANGAMRSEGIELRHLGVLTYVAQLGPQSQRQLGDALGLDKSTMVRILDDLEQQGLARRKRAGDRRIYEISITAQGRDRLRAASEHANAAMTDLLSALSPGEQAGLQELLERFITHARGQHQSGMQPATSTAR